jgi:hypothetical protein
MAGSTQSDPYIESPFDRIVDVHWKKKEQPPPVGGTVTYSAGGADITLPGQEGYGGGEDIFNVSVSGDIQAAEGGAIIGIPSGSAWSVTAFIYADTYSGSPNAALNAFCAIVDASSLSPYMEFGPVTATLGQGPATGTFSGGGSFPKPPFAIRTRFRGTLEGSLIYGFARNVPGTITITVT